MKRFQVTNMVWSLDRFGLREEIHTRIFHQGPDGLGNGGEPNTVRIDALSAYSKYGGLGRIHLRFRTLTSAVESQMDDIREDINRHFRNGEVRLACGCQNIVALREQNQIAERICIQLALMNRHQFCDAVIKVLKELFRFLGVQDDGGFLLGRFELHQTTMCLVGKDWVLYADFLKAKHGLSSERVRA